MSRVSCKICRRLGVSVCGRDKCAFKRKPYAPGVHGKGTKRRRNVSEYGSQLREKQKLKFMYGLRERQFRNYVKEAAKRSGNTADNLLAILESRLDSTVFRLGLAHGRAMAKQIVSHGHIMVNGRRVTVPSLRVRKEDKIIIRPQSVSKGIFKDLDISLKKYIAPPSLALDKEKKEGTVLGRAADVDSAVGLNMNSIIEFYSR